ncbi:MAG: CarD family transcriptional regulator [Candidatus Ornithospirochaeta sp.]|nr:CarD family transcriptional regulator [Candidatus Ornithospirochaeta sp.]
MGCTELSNQFNVGDRVVYPNQGVGMILSMEERRDRHYFRLRLSSSDMDVLLPVENAGSLGLRHTATKEETEEALSSLSGKAMHMGNDWKDRLNANLSLMKEGSIMSIAKVVNSLYSRSKIKELPVQERRIYDNAIAILVEESSYVLGIEAEETRKLIFSRLEKCQYPHSQQ